MMSKSHCIDCMRFDPPKDCSGEMGYCTQCGEKTNSYCPKCFWFVPKRGVKNGDEKEKNEPKEESYN